MVLDGYRFPSFLFFSSVFSLPCVSRETHNPQRVFIRIQETKGRSLCQAFLAETMETGNKNRCVIEAHVLRRKLLKD